MTQEDFQKSLDSSPQQGLTHLDKSGEAQMVDVSAKASSVRQAVASGRVRMKLETFTAIQSGNAPKGDVLSTARIAGIMAAKQTADLIPLCHPLPLQKINVQIIPLPELPGYEIQATAKTKAETKFKVASSLYFDKNSLRDSRDNCCGQPKVRCK